MLDHQPHQLTNSKSQEDKSKVTLYLSTDTHRQLKIRSVVEDTPMYSLAEKAISFYLAHSETVDHNGHGHNHQLHNCPKCAEKLIFRSGELVSVNGLHQQESHKDATRDLVLTP